MSRPYHIGDGDMQRRADREAEEFGEETHDRFRDFLTEQAAQIDLAAIVEEREAA